MTQTCLTCSHTFEILPQEKQFYEEKIKLPLPTNCPQCRNIRRMSFRNDRKFYQRTCDKSGQPIISIYPPNSPYKVYHQSEWWKQINGEWDPMDDGQDYDFNKPFFDQFAELQLKVPRLGMDLVNCQNSDYCNYCGDDKDCYLDIAGEANEDCYFNLFTKYSKDTADCTFAYHSTLCYESIQVHNCYNARFCMYCENTSDSWFCYDMKGCSDCLFSHNLRQQKYCIFNKPYSKEEYFQKMAALELHTSSGLQRAIKEWQKMLEKSDIIYRDQYQALCEDSSGNDIKNCKNTQHSFNVVNAEDCAYLYDVLDAKDCYDLNYSLYKPEVACELISTLSMRYSAFCMASHYCNNVFYCDLTNNSSYLFGCIGLNQKKYCILNKQYSKEEYENLLPKIIEHMKSTGEYGEFFPARLSPHQYEETVANEYFPLTNAEKSEIQNSNETEPTKTITTIPDSIKDTPEDVINQILCCNLCQKNYRIIAQEYRFYKKMQLPIPRLCPLCRHNNRNKLRNARKLREDCCSKCKKAIQTTFPENHGKQIYCEECYLKTI